LFGAAVSIALGIALGFGHRRVAGSYSSSRALHLMRLRVVVLLLAWLLLLPPPPLPLHGSLRFAARPTAPAVLILRVVLRLALPCPPALTGWTLHDATSLSDRTH
jgi:hypothetical protein